MKLPSIFLASFFRLFSDSSAGQKSLGKLFMTLLFITTIIIEIYTLVRTDCSYALEFVITNFTFIATSLGMSLFNGMIRTKQLSLQYQNGNGNGNHNGNSNGNSSGNQR
jgi:hypothetical protein